MGRKVLLVLVAALASIAGSASAQGLVIDIGSDVANTGYYPAIVSPEIRPWDIANGATPYACSWEKMEPTLNSTSGYAACKTELDAIKAKGATIFFTIGGGGHVPTWANSGTQCLATSGQRTYFTDYVTSVMTYFGRGYFAKIEPWNESNLTTSWAYPTCTDAQMGVLMQGSITAIKAIDPTVSIIQPSVVYANGPNDPVTNPVPAIGMWHADQMLKNCAGCAFTYLNHHPYPQIVASTDNTAKYDWSQVATMYRGVRNVGLQDGFTAPLIGGEGYTGESTNGGTSFNSDFMAGSNCASILLQSSLGEPEYVFYAAQDQAVGDTRPTLRGGLYGVSADTGLNKTGQALRSCNTWLSGAAWTVPLAHTAASNKLSVDLSTATPGLISGPGGCAGAPVGTGALPAGVTWSAQHATYDSVYVVSAGSYASGTHMQLRICGSDATASSGTVYPSLNFAAKGAVAGTFGQNNYFGVDLALAAGDYCATPGIAPCGVSVVYPNLTEYDGAQAYLANTVILGVYPTTQPLANQRVEYRVPIVSATAASVVPNIQFGLLWNGASPIATDITFDIGAPKLDSGMVWTGTLTKTSVNRYVYIDDLGGSTVTTPAGSCWYRDQYNVVRPVSGCTGGSTGSITLNQAQPVIVEAAITGFWNSGR